MLRTMPRNFEETKAYQYARERIEQAVVNTKQCSTKELSGVEKLLNKFMDYGLVFSYTLLKQRKVLRVTWAEDRTPMPEPVYEPDISHNPNYPMPVCTDPDNGDNRPKPRELPPTEPPPRFGDCAPIVHDIPGYLRELRITQLKKAVEHNKTMREFEKRCFLTAYHVKEMWGGPYCKRLMQGVAFPRTREEIIRDNKIKRGEL